MGKTHSKADGFCVRAKRGTHQRGQDALYGSLESLSTAVSLSSHADRCLLKSYGSLDNLRLYDGADCSITKKQSSRDYQLLEGTSSEREEQTASGEEQTANGEEDATRRETEGEDRECKERAVQAVLDKATQALKAKNSIPQTNGCLEDIKVPDSLLEKLTAEDWNELVSFLCSFMEKSLQSSLAEQLSNLQAARPTTVVDSSGSSGEETANYERQHQARPVPVQHRRRPSRKSRPLSMPSLPHNVTQHHHSHKRSCKISSSPVDISLDDNCPAEQDRLRTCSSPHQQATTESSAKPSKHRICRAHSHSYNTTTVDNTEELLKMATIAIEQEIAAARGNYLTLAQLKDLGLSLRRDQPNKSIEDNSQFSMQCWPSTEVGNLMKQKKQRPRRRRSRKAVNKQIKDSPPQQSGQIAELDQVYYLGPEPVDSGRDSPATNMAVADLDTKTVEEKDKENDAKEEAQDSQDESQSCYGVMHLHQHNHHHFHHVIHHSLSRPAAPLQDGSASSPDMPLSQ